MESNSGNVETKNTPNQELILAKNENNEILGHKTRWSKENDLNLILYEYSRINSSNKLKKEDEKNKYKSIRKSRWGPENEKIFTPPCICEIPKDIEINEFENLVRKYKLNELEKKIGTSSYLRDESEDDEDLRQPSPEPIYDKKTGQRINTKENRIKDKYHKQRNLIIKELILYDKSYKPPKYYKIPKLSKKLYISNNDKYNFTRILIGPGGETHKYLEKITECRISIKNQQKENDTKTNDLLHVLIESDDEEKLNKAVNIILPYLDENSEVYLKAKASESLNIDKISKKNKIIDDSACEICGEKGHQNWCCPKLLNQYKQEVQCQYCGDKGHPSIDCPLLKQEKDKIDLKNLMDKKLITNEINQSVLFTGNLNNNVKNINDYTFGEYEETLVNNYAKLMLLRNKNVDKQENKDIINDPRSISSNAVKYDMNNIVPGMQIYPNLYGSQYTVNNLNQEQYKYYKNQNQK